MSPEWPITSVQKRSVATSFNFCGHPSRSGKPLWHFVCKQPGHIRTECPLNKEAKKEKKKKKAMVATWSDSNVSFSDEESEINIKANLYLMAKEDKVCDDDCHNGFPPRLGWPQNKWSRHRSFLYKCDRSPGIYIFKLGTEIPNLKQYNWSMIKVWDSKLGNTIMREEGLAPSRRPFENGTN